MYDLTNLASRLRFVGVTAIFGLCCLKTCESGVGDAAHIHAQAPHSGDGDGGVEYTSGGERETGRCDARTGIDCGITPGITDPLAFSKSHEEVSHEMARCANLLFADSSGSPKAFFEKVFERRFARLKDTPDGARISACSGLFSSSLVQPIIQSANPEYLMQMVKLVGNSSSEFCSEGAACIDRMNSGPLTRVIDGIEYYRPEASALVRSLKRLLGLWVHVNVYLTPAGSQHGFGLHTDRE